ncbi:Phosphatidylinositol 4-phosphate 5-kinase its3 (1-phosphatidylinositol 4-phosphate kinase) (Diphosphoinositide kinase) (PIP5K) (PtdIns(4)P-5-kinase) [Durusdinium trenchii]|uniref:Phosphatidylinositol 4-phosphate 5-kinase its3 (1-phosphatidylinositol 4-phosphate kinase) (Diphosphoinositide kinase) (PIP5K) (PtdIns(4)P-5-kinase) n=1 Tax=Durusdinium trenchii TaxID=1381693 RepID=A0ABP0HPH2_9DINO
MASTDMDKLIELNAKTYKQQAVWFLNAYWKVGPSFSENPEETEKIWMFHNKCVELDPKGAEGNELDELKAHILIEQLEGAVTVTKMREALREVDVDFNGKVSLTEFLCFKYKVQWEVLVNAPQGSDEDQARLTEAAQAVEDAQTAMTQSEEQQKLARENERASKAAAAEADKSEAAAKATEDAAKAEEEAANAEESRSAAEQSRAAAEESRAAAELERQNAEEAATKAKEAKEAAEASRAEADAKLENCAKMFQAAQERLDTMKKTVQGAGAGKLWWMDRELTEAKKYMSPVQLARLEQGATAEMADTEQWACPACTLLNPASAQRCDACGAPVDVAPAFPVDNAAQHEASAPAWEEMAVPGTRDAAAATAAAAAAAVAATAVAPAPARELQDRVLEELCGESKSAGLLGRKHVPFAFTVSEFVEHFAATDFNGNKRKAVAWLQEELVDRDVVNTVPYVKFPRLANGDQLLRFGRRFFAEHARKHREKAQCSACGHQSFVDLLDEMGRSKPGPSVKWTCSECTCENEVVVRPEQDLAAVFSTTLHSVAGSVAGRVSAWIAPDPDAMANQLRRALQFAVLHHAGACEEHDLVPRVSDFFAADRAVRQVSEHVRTIYAPVACAALRRLFGVSEDVFCECLFDHAFQQRSNDGGASSAMFFKSQDNHFVVKTISKGEMQVLRGILMAYFEHVRENPDSLLPRFLGLFKVALVNQEAFHCVIMANVFDTMPVSEAFDLKGSTGNRLADETANGTLKDLNWRSRGRRIDTPLASQVLAQLEADAGFLHTHGLMDYSLLVGFARISTGLGGPIWRGAGVPGHHRHPPDVRHGQEA